MKRQTRILGIDDSPFSFEDETTEIVGALVRTPNYLEAVMKSQIWVDGDDSTDRIVEMVRDSRYRGNIQTIFLDGIALGGFNVVDLRRLSEYANVPVVSVSRKEPDMGSIKSALKKKFADWRERFDLVTENEIAVIETQYKPLHVQYVGIGLEDVKALIGWSTVRGALPEPLRMAHLISTALKKGESYGRA